MSNSMSVYDPRNFSWLPPGRRHSGALAKLSVPWRGYYAKFCISACVKRWERKLRGEKIASGTLPPWEVEVLQTFHFIPSGVVACQVCRFTSDDMDMRRDSKNVKTPWSLPTLVWVWSTQANEGKHCCQVQSAVYHICCIDWNVMPCQRVPCDR